MVSAVPVAIKRAKAIIPGYGSDGAPFGLLVPSSDVVAGIRPRRKTRVGSSRAPSASELPPSWLDTLLGFKSIATTHTTHAAAQAAISSGLDWLDASNELRKPSFNADIESMLTAAVRDVLQHHAASASNFSAARSIAGHIHISATSNVRTPYALLETRQAAGCHKPGLPIITLLSGCSGLLFALQHARFLLGEAAAQRDDNAYVLITCSNDLLPFAHARGRCPSERSESIDDWLFQAIFGEGVGAIIVGHGHRGSEGWVIADLDWQAVTDEWRVTMQSDRAGESMLIRAREVGITFREHVPRAAVRGLGALGLAGFSDLHRLCIHESNPNLVAHVAAKLDAPDDRVHSLSPTVGTLAGVSAFSLLDEALNAFQKSDTARDSIVCALIGESGNSVVAGHVSLRHAS